jgi:hypothetical protein
MSQSSARQSVGQAKEAQLNADILMFELTSLRREILQRGRTQDALLGLNLTAIAAIGTLVLSRGVGTLVLLVLPAVSSALAFLWLDHARVIARIGRHIERQLWPRLAAIGNELPNWEEDALASGSRLLLAVPFWGTLLAIFAAPSIVALIALFVTVRQAWALALAVLEALLVAALAWIWVTFVVSSLHSGSS